MKTFIYNIGYFLRETFRTIRFNPLSNLFSTVGTGLILFLLGMVLAGWSMGDTIVEALQEEAQVSAYFADGVNNAQAAKLTNQIRNMSGVLEARYIDAEQAYEQNRDMLGNEAEILELFDENPFEAYIDIRINLEQMDQILKDVQGLLGIEYVRDNREILEQMKGIVDALKIMGILIACAVGITTLIIISHMIRQGIYNNKDQINTLRLLGAPGGFIGFPFILAGTFLTLLGGILAAAMLIVLMNKGYNQLSGYIMFLPLPSLDELRDVIAGIILGASACLGFAGSLFGLSSIGRPEH